jgi:2-succinyl-6-hydroxy-2,4-cyclohexadiene-1-carboxylate synthase
MPYFGSDGERIHYDLLSGPSEAAPTLVLQHGYMASRASFHANVARLRERFTVVNVELLGHGRSDAPATLDPYRPPAAIERLVGLIESLQAGPVLFCGHSLGGGVGTRLALTRPDLLAGLVVMNSEAASGPGHEWRERLRPIMQAMADRVRVEGTDALRDSALFPARGKRLDPASRELLAADFDQMKREGVAGTACALVVDVNCFERLGELRVPTLVILGDRDASFGRNAPAFVDAMPDGIVHTATIQSAGHAANLEQPEVFERLVMRFAGELGLLAGKELPSLGGRGFAMAN